MHHAADAGTRGLNPADVWASARPPPLAGGPDGKSRRGWSRAPDARASAFLLGVRVNPSRAPCDRTDSESEEKIGIVDEFGPVAGGGFDRCRASASSGEVMKTISCGRLHHSVRSPWVVIGPPFTGKDRWPRKSGSVDLAGARCARLEGNDGLFLWSLTSRGESEEGRRMKTRHHLMEARWSIALCAMLAMPASAQSTRAANMASSY
jgi:hypothetical protein